MQMTMMVITLIYRVLRALILSSQGTGSWAVWRLSWSRRLRRNPARWSCHPSHVWQGLKCCRKFHKFLIGGLFGSPLPHQITCFGATHSLFTIGFKIFPTSGVDPRVWWASHRPGRRIWLLWHPGLKLVELWCNITYGCFLNWLQKLWSCQNMFFY